MFRSTYGYIESHNSGDAVQLMYKSVDFARDIEVVHIGAASGEDAPNKDIYIIRYMGKIIPFLCEKIVLCGADINVFNKGQLSFPRAGIIPIIALAITNVGGDLKGINADVRGYTRYVNCFSTEFHGYEFSDTYERDETIILIKEALPILYFDRFNGVFSPEPSICVSANVDTRAAMTEERARMKAIEVAEEFCSRADRFSSSLSLYDHLAKLLSALPMTVEQICSELLDIERAIFNCGWGSCNIGLLERQEFLYILNKSYQQFYSTKGISPDSFRVSIILKLRDRLLARVLFEQYTKR